MSKDKPLPPIQQATAFQRFTIRLVDGKFVRVPKPDLPSVQGVDQSATSNQPEIRELFRVVHGQPSPALKFDAPADVAHDRGTYPDPSFDPPAEYRLPSSQ